MHHNRGPLPTPANGYQFTLVGNAVDGGSATDAIQVGHRHPQQPLRADSGQRRLQLQRLVDCHRGRLRELQRLRSQLRPARHGRARQRRSARRAPRWAPRASASGSAARTTTSGTTSPPTSRTRPSKPRMDSSTSCGCSATSRIPNFKGADPAVVGSVHDAQRQQHADPAVREQRGLRRDAGWIHATGGSAARIRLRTATRKKASSRT